MKKIIGFVLLAITVVAGLFAFKKPTLEEQVSDLIKKELEKQGKWNKEDSRVATVCPR